MVCTIFSAESFSDFPLGVLGEEVLYFVHQTFMIFFHFYSFILKRKRARNVWISAASRYSGLMQLITVIYLLQTYN